MAPIDAQQLLNALAPLLAPDGSIKGPLEASRISSLMKDAGKMVSKCVYLNILKITSNSTTLEKFITVGGWETLNSWLQDCKGPAFNGFLLEILKVYKDLPVTIDLLKKNNAAKTIKQLAKSDVENIKVLSGDIVVQWMKTVREARTDDSDKKKEKKRKKDHHHHKDKTTDVNGETNDKLGDSNHKHEHNKHRHNSGEEKQSKRPKTVKTLPAKFRSTGLEDQTIAPVKKKQTVESKPLPVIPKRNNEEPPEKKARLTLTIPASSLSSGTTMPSSSSPTSVSPQEITHGKIKIIPAKRLPTHEIHEDSGFMESISRPPRYGQVKKKKKITSPVTTTIPTLTTSGPPQLRPAVQNTSPTSASPLSPTSTLAQRLPSVPSFYKDTFETTEETEENTERSPSPDELNPPNLQMPLLSPERPVTPTDDDLENKNPVAVENNEGSDVKDGQQVDENDSETKSLLTNGPTKKKKAKKKVRWVDDNRLQQFFYFELDETERENVNRPKDFNSLKKAERMMEGRAMDRRFSHDNQNEALQWKRPELIEGLTDVVPGVNSADREIQNQREQGVLQALFFSKAMLPDTPAEPDLESVDVTEPKTIPLEDVSTVGEEYSYTYDNLESKPDKLKDDPPILIQPSPGLPLELTNILNNFSQNPPTGNNVSNDMMTNVQNMLAVIMQASQDGNQNEMIEKLRLALEPFRHQLPELFQMQPNFAPPNNMMSGPPRLGPGLLGAAPPGFVPLAGQGPAPHPPPPPPRFMGPPGPGGPPRGPGGPPCGPGGPPCGPGGPPRGPPCGPGGPGPVDDWGENMMGGPMGPRGPIRHGFPRQRGGPMNRGPMRGGRGGGPGRGGRDRSRDGDRRDDRGGGRDRNERPVRGGRDRDRGRPVCRHFVTGGGCKYGDSCSFLHPNGPALNAS